MLKIQRIPIDGSSQVASAGYSEPTQELDIEFKPFKATPAKPNSVYRYSNVTPEMFSNFMAAESHGRWVNQNLKALAGSHPCRKLSTEEAN